MDPVDDLLRRWLVEDPVARTMLGSGAPQPMRVHVEPDVLPVGVVFYDGSRVTVAPIGATAQAPKPRVTVTCSCDLGKTATCKHCFGAVRYMLTRLRDVGHVPLGVLSEFGDAHACKLAGAPAPEQAHAKEVACLLDHALPFTL